MYNVWCFEITRLKRLPKAKMEFVNDCRNSKLNRKYCSVRGCNSKSHINKNLSFHKLPKSGVKIRRINYFGNNEIVDKRVEWLRVLGIQEVNKELVICSKHFNEDDYYFPNVTAQVRVLKKDAVPRYVKEPESSRKKEILNIKRKERLLRRQSEKENSKSISARRRRNKKFDTNNEKVEETCENHEVVMVNKNSIVNLNMCEMNPHENEIIEPENHDEDCELLHQPDVMFQETEMSDSVIDRNDVKDSCMYNGNEMTDFSGIQKNNSEDKAVQVNTDYLTFTLSSFITSEKELISLCNIKSFKILDELIKIMDNIYPSSRKRLLSTRDSILLTTAKLKLDITFAALSAFFKPVTDVTIRNTFYDTVKKLSTILQSVIKKVPKEEILRNMPKCFQKYKATTSVLDCTEIKIQTPKCLKCQIKFYSHYKSHLTVKFMTEVTPAGLITFVSESFGGRASDKAIFNHSGILQHLESTRDAVMVDRGFLIDEECIQRRVQLIRPPFMKKRNQLSEQEAIENRDIASARVHIERMNQRIKQFQILNHNFPWHMIDYVDDIFIICCGLANLDSPILGDDKF